MWSVSAGVKGEPESENHFPGKGIVVGMDYNYVESFSEAVKRDGVIIAAIEPEACCVEDFHVDCISVYI